MCSLKEVTFSGCDALDSYNCPNSVESLEIRDCDSLTSLTFSAMQEHPLPLTESIISDFNNIKSDKPIPTYRLTSLQIRYCQNLKSFPHEHFQCLTSLEELWIYECPRVVSFAVANDVRNTTSSSSSFLLPPSLVSLELHDFVDVESFSEVLQHLPCLKTLYIRSCPKITDLVTIYDPSNLTIDVWE
ncbi:unnamed protein product [Lactuca virosa]|uniref:Disease resistance protein At4g27190-like leucine-rich repeats domain-containing protein n=1 Tax=Lactuca virosa TaxID=75947 RepID=A0AAU9NSW0_9ASTR|nr:unnamed protein product [Lactuca virosa]